MINSKTFEKHESQVRSYCHDFPAVFNKAKGSYLFDEDGYKYIDFFMGAGALNYGHNHHRIKNSLIEYISEDNVMHSLDMYTIAKRHFIDSFQDNILRPRGLDYKLQFTGPTGTNCVEAALKLARKVTGRTNIIAFTNGFHGMTLGALAATANKSKRASAHSQLSGVIHLPFDGFFGPEINTIEYIETLLEHSGSGIEAPAAFILEIVQGEGGINVASESWLKALSDLSKKLGSLLIIDDIQAGCGRTGQFFSFERAQIKPDVVCLSKSLSGYGLPLSLVMIKPEHDIWAEGEHNGTFRGNNLAFVSAKIATEFWKDELFLKHLQHLSKLMALNTQLLEKKYSYSGLSISGIGLMYGFKWQDSSIAANVRNECFKQGLIVETCGANGEVLKLFPPLNVSKNTMEQAFMILDKAISNALCEVIRPISHFNATLSNAQ